MFSRYILINNFTYNKNIWSVQNTVRQVQYPCTVIFFMNCLFPERNMSNTNQKKKGQHGRKKELQKQCSSWVLDYQWRLHHENTALFVELRGLVIKKGYDFSKELFVNKREEVTGCLRHLRNDEYHNRNFSPNMRWAGRLARPCYIHKTLSHKTLIWNKLEDGDTDGMIMLELHRDKVCRVDW